MQFHCDLLYSQRSHLYSHLHNMSAGRRDLHEKKPTRCTVLYIYMFCSNVLSVENKNEKSEYSSIHVMVHPALLLASKARRGVGGWGALMPYNCLLSNSGR